jgi:serine/threonine-protein kinase
MPLVEGGSLRERLNRDKHLPLDETVRIVGELAGGLALAHERGIVHRDLKPENILFLEGQAVVADFGIAKALDVAGGERLTQTGLVVGTPTYMSPEQAGGVAVDGRSDLYSLGCLAYEMLGGEPPFTGPTPQAVLARHAVDPVPKLRTIRPEVPEGVAKAIEKALAKVPADRFGSVEAFARALGQAITREAIEAEARKREAAAGRRRMRWAAGAVGALAVGAWLLTVTGGPTYQNLAVLTPTNLLNDPEQQLLIQGVHNALIGELQQAGISVKARRSTLQFRDRDQPAREIALALGVDALMEPSVRWGSDSVEMEVRLVDGETEEYVGAPIVARGAAQDVLGLYRQLVREVADGLQLTLSPEAQARLARADPVDPAAYEDYLRGQFHWNALTPADLERALRYFEQALEKDPDFAQAYAGISLLWGARQQMGFSPPSEAVPRVREALERALGIDSTSFEVQYAAACARTWTEWDWEAAEESFLRAIGLNPQFADLRAYYAHFLMMMGRDEESDEQMALALELDRIKPLVQSLYAFKLMFGGDPEVAMEYFQEALRINPGNILAHNGLNAAYHELGLHELSVNQSSARAELRGDTLLADTLRVIYSEEGYQAVWSFRADGFIEASRTRYVSPYSVANFLIKAGRVDECFEWLERGIEQRDPNIPYSKVLFRDPAITEDPRFKELLRRVNLPTSLPTP